MAKGDYTIFNNVHFQSVTSYSRRYGVMFNPGSSRSRLRIRDSGRRYLVRLLPLGTVEFSPDDGATWKTIDPLRDPCTNQLFPGFISHENLRIGEELTGIKFDMIAVGRGRIIGKEKDTDRLFHVYIDEMFRTKLVQCNVGENPRRDPNGNELPPTDDYPGITDPNKDLPIPPFNMKLDPEYFTLDPPTVIVPPEATRTYSTIIPPTGEQSYSRHPSSLRLPVFNELLQIDISDVMLVLERARTWYLKDTRSQLAITVFEDFNFSDQDLKDVFTEEALRDILKSIKKMASEMLDNWFLQAIFNLMDSDKLAKDWRTQIEVQGSGVIVFAAYALLGLLIYLVGNSGALATTDTGKLLVNPRKLIDYLAQPNLKPSAQPYFDDALGKLMGLISELMLRARRNRLQQYGDRPDVGRKELPDEWTLDNQMPTPNQPPSWMPAYVRTTYMQRKGAGKGAWKRFHTGQEESKRVWLAVNANGSLEAFSRGDWDDMYHSSQGAPNGNWQNASWTRFFQAGDKIKELTWTRNPNGKLEIIRIDPDNHVFHTTQSAPNNGTFGSWKQLYPAGEKRISISVEANLDGRLELFAVGDDGRIYRTAQTTAGNWSGNWVRANTSSELFLGVWMARNADGTLEVFAININHRIRRTRQTSPGGGWSQTWAPFFTEGDHLAKLAVGRNADGTLELIGIADDNGSIWHTKQDSPGNWPGPWSPLFQSDDALEDLWVTTNAMGWLDVVGRSSNNRVWHSWQTAPNGNFEANLYELEAIRGRISLSLAPNPDGSIEIVGNTPRTGLLDDPPNDPEHAWRMRLKAEKRFAIQFSQVLDIGIGSSHWNENWQTHFGGEIHALLAPRPLFQGERYSLTQYRFLNGPVIDGDAFNDGTTNFYMFVKLGPPGATGAGYLQRYAILWFDEQTYFTQRWRLLHPTDDILGDLFSLPHYMRENPDWYDFHLGKYWDPFRDNLIDDNSRMVLRRNVIVVTGLNPSRQRYDIYTIVFNYGLCDHSWRWRLFPQAEQKLIDRDLAQDQDPTLPADVTGGTGNAYVVVNMIDIRDDTTLHVRGSLRNPLNQALRVGRWVQRYLPADCRHVPDRHELAGVKPVLGFDHKWDFVSEDTYKRADKYYQFGVYENLIDSRGQYYRVELLAGPQGEPSVQDVVGRVWKNDDTSAGDKRLRMNTINFHWGINKQADGAIVKAAQSDNPDELWADDFNNRPSISMYEGTTRFRILERKPLGLIAVFYDKRDDELQATSNLPQPTTLSHDDVETTEIPNAWKTDEGETIPPALPPPAFSDVGIRFISNHRVYQPPNVRKAQIIIDSAPGLRLLHVSFWTPQTEQEVCENIWKVSLAALEPGGVVFPIFSVTRYGNFVRRAYPDAPLPTYYTLDLGDAWRYDFNFPFTKEVETKVRRYCTTDGHIEFGTSLWFEDIVGHRALAQELVFA